MASPITHIVLADKVFDKFFRDKNRKDFFIGTVFPDIRYLIRVKKEKTHLSQTNLKEILNEKNSFISGLKFHCLVDAMTINFVRSNILIEGKFTFKSDSVGYYATINLEDKLFYGKINNWKEIINFFKDVLPEEKEIYSNIKHVEIKRWHQIIQNNLCEAPNDKSCCELARATNIPKNIVSKIIETTEMLKKDKKVIKAIEDFYNNFESLLKQ